VPELWTLDGTARIENMEDITSLQGPLENIDGKLILRIPLAAGGQALVACSRGIGVVDGDFLTVVIQPWLSSKLGISAGSIVTVDNRNGKFNIRPSDEKPAV
jgi:hypothetical protein